MNYQQIKCAIPSLSLNQMYGIHRMVEKSIQDVKNSIIKSVRMTKLPRGGYELEFNGMRYEIHNHAYNRRLRMYNRIPGIKPGTFKRGNVVIREWTLGTSILRMEIANGTLETDAQMLKRVNSKNWRK